MRPKARSKILFPIIKGTIRFFYPRTEIVGLENLPKEPCIIVGNHTQINGPICGELFFDDSVYIWCAHEMMDLKKVPKYAYTDFWSHKSPLSRPFYKLLSYIIAPVSVVIFNNARTIAVHKDARILRTFKDTVAKLQSGCHVIIFPEHDAPHNHIVYDFQEGFVDVAKLYHSRTGKELSFVPMYIAPRLKKIYIGKPIDFCADTPLPTERHRICEALMAEITDLAEALPLHTVVPYRNIPKRKYPTNIPREAKNEKTYR